MNIPIIVVDKLEALLGFTFQDKKLVSQVFIHRSYLNEHKGVPLDSNERLEFLGDAVLELVVTEYLYETYPAKEEGELTALRSSLVKREHLAMVAKHMNLGEYLLFSKGEMLQGGNSKDYILANTMEALIGAIYLEKGYAVSREVIEKQILVHIDTILSEKKYIDSKSLLQELSQEKLSVTPYYDVLEERGPDHQKEFVVGVYFSGELKGTGAGSSKRRAEENAASNALDGLGWDNSAH